MVVNYSNRIQPYTSPVPSQRSTKNYKSATVDEKEVASEKDETPVETYKTS